MTKSSSSLICLENSVSSTNNLHTYDKIQIPYFSLYSDRIVIHPRPFVAIHKRSQNVNSANNLKKKKYQGQISKVQKSTIKKRITAWLESIHHYNKLPENRGTRSERYPVFITVTLSSEQIHTDQEIKKKLLDLFIKQLKTKFGVKEYFWRAESQKNGNIHFHIIVDTYCNFFELRDEWNRIQNVLGYLDKFELKHKHRRPPSVNVKGVKDVKNFVNYVMDYATKKAENRLITGRLFGMSDSLRKVSIYQNVLDSELSSYLSKYMDHNYFKVYRDDFFTVLTFKKEFYESKFYSVLNSRSSSYYCDVYMSLYGPKNKRIKVTNTFKEALVRQPTQLKFFEIPPIFKEQPSFSYKEKRKRRK